MSAPWDRLPSVIGEAGAEMLRRFRAAVEGAYPDRLRALILFGSRARVNGGPDGAWDVALFIEGFGRDRDGRRLHLLVAPFHIDFAISTIGLPATRRSGSPDLLTNIDRDGMLLRVAGPAQGKD